LLCRTRPPATAPLFPYTTLFRSSCGTVGASAQASVFGFPNAFLGLVAEPVVMTIAVAGLGGVRFPRWFMCAAQVVYTLGFAFARSEEHTSELQSRDNLVCRLLLE